MAKHGSGIGSQLNKKSPAWRNVKSDRNTMPNVGAGEFVDIPVGKEAMERAHEVENGVSKKLVKFELGNVIPQNIKGKQIQNLPSPVHDVCAIAITTKEGCRNAQAWSEEDNESRASGTKKTRSRKARRATMRNKRMVTNKKVCPTPEALASIELRTVHTGQSPLTIRSSKSEGTKTDDGLHLVTGREQEAKVRSERPTEVFASGPLREGPGIYEERPSQAVEGNPPSDDTMVMTAVAPKSGGKPPSDDTIVTTAVATTSVGTVTSHAASRAVTGGREKDATTPATLCPPQLLRDGTPVTGALKYLLKNKTNDRRLSGS